MHYKLEIVELKSVNDCVAIYVQNIPVYWRLLNKPLVSLHSDTFYQDKYIECILLPFLMDLSTCLMQISLINDSP